jgi:alkyl sulfatase BDS1-like metallo-beta-lactamase superfamily hydrolase
VRGYDVSNITFVRGDTGWIVFDPLISVETAKAAYEFVTQRLGPLPVRAVVYSHSHVDHFGGVRGIVDEADVDAGKVRIIAPEGFMEEAVSENVIAGTAMGRRAIYMYGSLLPRGERGGVSAGLGQTTSTGTISLIAPTDTITKTGQELTIDGVRMVFQMTPGTEAPAEMNTWFPQWNALWMAENVQNTLHNLYTLRGAKVRDALQWSKYIDETVELYGAGAEVKFQSHHWPLWGNAKILDYLAKQRDLYKYIHDQSVRMLNQGATGPEIAEALRLPPELDLAWYNRGYYGTVKHDARAVYQRYMGWYDANPANLDPLPPEPAAKKYVEYMGGEAAILARARVDFEAGEYRWVAEALKHVVFANPESDAARELLADTFEQLGYQAESGAWRSVYLQGAFELRHGIPEGGGGANNSPDVFRAMPPEMLFDYLAIRLDAPKAAGKKLVLVLNFTDLGSQYALLVQNSVLHNYSGPAAAALAANADATLTLSKTALYQILRMEATPAQKVESGELRISGRRDALGELLGMMAPTPFWFPIVTP